MKHKDAMKSQNKKVSTSWGGVAKWYDETVEEKGSYQQDLILPNLLRLMAIKKGEKVLDLACGQGLFSREFAKAGAKVVASDISSELVEIAKKKSPPPLSTKSGQAEIDYHVASADSLPFLKDGVIEKIAMVLALQNIENMNGTLAECARVLAPNGKLYLVLNHPAFRIPKESAWEFDEATKIQYRRIDRYISSLKSEIDMNPGLNAPQGRVGRVMTLSFHRPLQAYVKALGKSGFAITRLEEWTSHKKSQKGPRAEAEDRARAEIPLFLTLEAQKM